VLSDTTRVERVARGCGEDQFPFLPRLSGGLAFGVLGPAVLGEGCEADRRDCDAALGGSGLCGVEGGSAAGGVLECTADAQGAAFDVEVGPGQAEELTAS
jgi:hypothetical protein